MVQEIDEKQGGLTVHRHSGLTRASYHASAWVGSDRVSETKAGASPAPLERGTPAKGGAFLLGYSVRPLGAQVRAVRHRPPGEGLTLPRFDCLACVSRAGDRSHVEAATLRERLPRIAIPLREPDPDVVLDLPSILAECYDNGA